MKSIFFCFFAIIQWWNGDDYEEPWWSSNMVGECGVNFLLLCFLLCAFYWGVYYVVNVHVIWWHDFVVSNFVMRRSLDETYVYVIATCHVHICGKRDFISFSIVDTLFCKIFFRFNLSWSIMLFLVVWLILPFLVSWLILHFLVKFVIMLFMECSILFCHS